MPRRPNWLDPCECAVSRCDQSISAGPTGPLASSKGGKDLPGEELQAAHDVVVRHAREEHPADQVAHPVLVHEAAQAPDALLRTPDDEAVLHELVEIGRDGRIDERMTPAAGIFAPIGHHDVLL